MVIDDSKGYSNVKNPLTRFRFWLIVKLAGKSVVVINANLSMADEEAGIDARVEDDVDGCLISNTSYPPRADGKILAIGQRPAAK